MENIEDKSTHDVDELEEGELRDTDDENDSGIHTDEHVRVYNAK